MSNQEFTLAEAMKLLFEQDVASAPERHPLEGSQCLCLPRFRRQAVEQWTEAEREHVRTCQTGYCQRMLALSWRGEHPPLAHLAEYARGEYPYQAAMQFHLADDGCRRCQLVVRILRELGAMARAVAVLYREGPLQPDEAATFAEPRAPLYLRQTSEDGNLIISVVESDPPEHELKVYVEAPGCGEAGGKVRLTLAGENETLERVLDLEKTEFGWEAEASFGKFEEAVARLGEDWVVAAVLMEPGG